MTLCRALFQGVTGTSMRMVRVEVTEPFNFVAGQYTSIKLAGGAAIPLSIASAPQDLPELAFIYHSTPGDETSRQFDDLLVQGGEWQLTDPAGDVCVGTAGDRILMLAGGTGIAQARSIARQHQQLAQRLTIRWVVENASEVTTATLATELGSIANLDFDLLEDPDRTPDNRLLEWAAAHLAHESYDRVLVSGSPAFVYAVVDKLVDAGIEPELESDVFSYAPRPPRRDRR